MTSRPVLPLAGWLAIVIVLAAGCVPVAAEPTAAPAVDDIVLTTPLAPVSTDLALAPSASASLVPYPPIKTATPTLPPYPWPTKTPYPTESPEPTETATWTTTPIPTTAPTPVVTPIPTAGLPFIPVTEGTTAQPFTVYYRDGELISAISSAPGAEARVFLDPVAEFGLYLIAKQGNFGEWGAISPDGRAFALMLSALPPPPPEEYMSSNDPINIFLFDVETRALRLFAETAYDPVWSPDGTRLAYRHDTSLWVADVETGEARRIVSPGVDDYGSSTYPHPYQWSPDGSRLLVVRQIVFEFYELNVAPADRPDAARVIVPADNGSVWVMTARWSPNTDEIVVSRYVDEPPYYGDYRDQVCVLNLDGVVTHCWTYDFRIRGPAWSPDGKWIAFEGYPVFDPEPADWDLWLLNVETGALSRLTHGEASEVGHGTVGWSPDGTQLLYRKYVGEGHGYHEAWVLSLIDGSDRRLVSPAMAKEAGLVIGP